MGPTRPLNVLHISESDAGGGAAHSAFRLHRALAREGHRSQMLVGRKLTDCRDVKPLKRHLGWRMADRAFAEVLDRLDLQYALYPSSFGVASDPWFRLSDVVQLHNTHGSYFSHSALPLLSARKPVVWFLHDQWAFTGHVAYSYECERWRHGCGACPYLAEYPRLRRDTSAALWRWKRLVYARSRLTIVTPSRWLGELARQSPLLGRFRVETIPYGVDLDVFRPRDRKAEKESLGLDPLRPVALFAAADATDRRKGGGLVQAILERTAGDLQLLTMGGEVRGDDEVARRYAAADVLVLPSLADNLPNTAIESIACGTPVAGFDVGGVGDAVRAGQTGALAAAGDVEAMAAGIRAVVGDEELRLRARAVAEAEYGVELEARRFADLYSGLVHRVRR